ncbi:MULTISPECIES: ABC transporter permease [Halomonadaceae]|uniref:ABC transporter permease n=1 Tax=Halomonadaceae TaxID=28256 RepID=UPI001598640B|nr:MULTISPECIES: ABC transporter permease [Halomonas]QJQ95219.1 ABC transporter permease [Halomonas sp. PA5]
MRLPKSAQWQLALPLSLFYIAFFAAPLMLLIGVSFFNDEMLTQPGLGSWKRFVGDAFYWKVTFDTIKLGAYTVCATILIGYPLALVYIQAGPRAKRILLFIILMPMLLSVVVRTFAWIVILSEQGVINQTIMALGLTSTPIRLLQTELGLVISLTQIEMPLMLLPLISVMARIDPNLIDASTSLGASRWGTLFKVIVPLSFPGLIAGCILVFASSTTAFISHSIIGGNRLIYLPLVIWQQASVLYNWPLAAVGAIVLLVFVSLCIALVTLVGKRSMRHLYV